MKNSLIPMEGPPPMLAYYIAEYESSKHTIPSYTMEEIAEHFDITIEQIEKYKALPSFRAEVRANLETIKDTHAHIRHKAQVQLELYIDTVVPKIMQSPDTPASEITKMLQFLAKTARVNDDPAEKAKVEAEANAKTVQQQVTPNLNIYLTTSPGQQPTPIDITPEKLINE